MNQRKFKTNREGNTKISKIRYAVFNNPTLIPTLVRDSSISKAILYSQLRRLVPYRVGIEFEYIGNFGSDFLIDLGKPNLSVTKAEREIESYFNILRYSQDSSYYRVKFKDRGLDSKPNLGLEEFRVSIVNYRQLSGLFKLLEQAKKYCYIPELSGIHIHIDFSKYYDNCDHDIVRKYIENNLDDVIQIFPKYTGTYNSPGCGVNRKGKYVNITTKHTIEFRIAPLTFDYSTIITWVIKCTKFVNRIINEMHLRVPDSNECDERKYPEGRRQMAISLNNLTNGQFNDVYRWVSSRGNYSGSSSTQYVTINNSGTISTYYDNDLSGFTSVGGSSSCDSREGDTSCDEDDAEEEDCSDDEIAEENTHRDYQIVDLDRPYIA